MEAMWNGIWDDGWTSGQAAIDGVDCGFEPRDSFLFVRTRGWHPWSGDQARLQLTLCVAGHMLPFMTSVDNGFLFRLTPPVRSLRSPARIEIGSATFAPDAEGVNLDPRKLGIDLLAIELLDESRQTTRELYRHPSPLSSGRTAVPEFAFDPANPPIDELCKRGLKVGRNTVIHFGTVIDAAHYWLIEIGQGVTIAPCCHILAHDASTKAFLGYSRVGRVVIEDHVFIGANSVILPGVRIGRSTVVGAGSVVTRDLPREVVAAGNPAKVICTLADYMERRRSEFANLPQFGFAYTAAGGIDEALKSDMGDQLGDGFGYVL